MSEFINTTIGECCEILDSSRIPLNEEERNKIPGNIPYYGANGVQDYIDKYIFDEDLILIAEDGGNFESYETRPIAYRISGKSWVNNHAHILRALKRYNQDYIFYSLVNKNILNYIVGGTRSKLNQRELKTITISIPQQKSEQTAIAHILSTVDKAIEQTEKLIAKYKRIKTGLMQDLLTKGIDENGNIRSEKTHKFKDSPIGRIPVEWEVINLENKKYFELATGGTPSTAKKEYWENGNIPWLSSGEVHNKKIKNTAVNITQLGFENSNARFYPIGSVLIALAGLGKTRGTVAITEIETTSNQSIAAIIPNQELYNSYFLYHQLDFRYEELRSISSGSGRAGLSLRILKTINVVYTDINEQKAIIKKLNQIDDFLNSNYKSLSKLSLLKSGLMQDLLTGKVRVPEELIEEINSKANVA
ncbi:restriction endonuclease subunit S [Melioribacter sp. OK-6-Me]|uniref:restriction endonuclease subunit S n=1 Tax=unclassified Melioribacter TaxID=2627329 RepID=UPI003EDB4B17